MRPPSVYLRQSVCAIASVLVVCGALGGDGPAAADSPDAVEFFERRVRPILANRCYKCHVGAKCKGELELDSREHLLHGGSRGPAIMPGDAEASLLIQAVRHDPAGDLEMPPEEEPLNEQQIADLATWIQAGAVWPSSPVRTPLIVTDEQRAHWAFQPLTDLPVPSKLDGASDNEIDRFIETRLASTGMRAALPADRRTLIRRVTFDLTGLPPAASEIDAFLDDPSPDAYARLVERLLASPRYGERWGRHWLDLARYADTDGHEFDTDKPNAYRYRDYVIDAFNRDVPYDQFIREQIAGDLLPPEAARLSDDGGTRMSPQGTAFLYLGEIQNNPVDAECDRANQVENQLDVLGKTFLGLTLACARCHDHKFDPIPTDEYYALAGFLHSTEKAQASVDTAARSQAIEERRQQLVKRQASIENLTYSARLKSRLVASERLADYLLAARAALLHDATQRQAAIAVQANRHNLDAAALAAWTDYLARGSGGDDPLFSIWRQLADRGIKSFDAAARELVRKQAETPASSSGERLFADFEQGFDAWESVGAAFGRITDDSAGSRGVVGQFAASSDRGSDRLVGRLRSQRFKIKQPHLWYRIAGSENPLLLRFSLILNDQPIPKFSATGSRHEHLTQRSFDLHELIGKEAYLEIVDEDPNGHITIDEIAFAGSPPPTIAQISARVADLIAKGSAQDAESLARAYQDLFAAALTNAVAGVKPPSADRELVAWAMRDDVPLAVSAPATEKLLTPADRQLLADFQAQRSTVEADIPSSTIAITARDAAPQDAFLYVRGECSNKGPLIARGCLSAIGPASAKIDDRGSGRAQLAEWIASPANPLTARVIVNRVWQHHFGQGLVRTVDNFGLMGETPSHPELLDDLARRFIASDWSIKSLQRMILHSDVYQQSSQPRCDTASDTDNRWLSHFPVQRLDAESIRDAMLAVAGNLNPTAGGPGVKLHLTPQMEGADVPPTSGPLDGDCRRSVYLEVRRNYGTPLLAVFDFPKPVNTVGARQHSAVPAQALALLNNEFVVGQARSWAERVLRETHGDRERVTRMYVDAFGREPDASEVDSARRFVARQSSDYKKLKRSAAEFQLRAWTDLGHALFNAAEFIFVP